MRKEYYILFILVLVFTFEGLYLPFLYSHGIPVEIVKFLLQLKYFIVLLYVIRVKSKITAYKFEILLYIVLIILFILELYQITTLNEFSITTFTVEIFPLLCYIAGRKLRLTPEHFRKCIKFILVVATINALYAIIDRFFIPESFWRDYLKQEEYLKNVKAAATDTFFDGLVGNFYYDPYALKIRRAIGGQGDPLAFAYALVLPIFLANYSFHIAKRIKYLILVVLTSALLLSLTRAIVISIMIAVLLNWIFKKNKDAIIISSAVAIMFILIFLGDKALSLIGATDSSSSGHISSLASVYNRNFSSILLGSVLSGDNQRYSYESGFLNILVSYGLIFVSAYYYIIYKIIKTVSKSSSSMSKAISLTGSVGVFTSIIFSQSFFTFTAYGLFWFLSGVIISNKKIDV